MKKKEVKFYLKKYKDNTALIIAIFHCNYFVDNRHIPLKYSTNIRIPIEAWDKENQIIKSGIKGVSDVKGKNYRLDDIEEKITSSYRRLSNLGEEITLTKLREALTGGDKERPKPKITLLGFMNDFKNTCGRKVQTVKNYGSTIRVLTEYCKSKQYHLDFDTVNMSFYKSFVAWCRNQSKKTNTIGGYIKHIKMFMGEAQEIELHQNMIYKSKKFKTLEETIETIYLNEFELEFLLKLDLSFSKTLQASRDFFLIAAYSALRHSDWKQLSESCFQEDGSFIIKTIKTKVKVHIPRHHIIHQIISRNHDKIPRAYTNQYSNRTLIEVGKIAHETYENMVKEGITFKNIDKSKFLKMRTHTGRRSFCTNAFLSGMPAHYIMKCSGHRKESNFYKYIRMTEEELKDRIKDYPFFTGKPDKSNFNILDESHESLKLVKYSNN